MGYKLAGYDVLGGVEIDPEMMKIYRANHNPKHSYLMGVQDFKNILNHELPQELFNLDVLDGSPPCSSFSMAGSREKAWGEKKKFREGQAEQVLDDLFFHYIDIAKKLRPKVVVAENVKGLIQGNARGYVKEIFQAFNKAGYEAQLFLLNASRMGVPQIRERTFFIARRKDLRLPKVELSFNELQISIKDAVRDIEIKGDYPKSNSKAFLYWHRVEPGMSFAMANETGSSFNRIRLDNNYPCNTVTSYSKTDLYHWNECCRLNNEFFKIIQTFPLDYNFLEMNPGYVCGMSVPPLMMQRVASKIAPILLRLGAN